METLYTLSIVALLMAVLLLLAYLQHGRKYRWQRTAAAISAALSGIVLLIFLGFFPRTAAVSGCTAYVIQGGHFSVERSCPEK